jgi:hypothetical protein
MLRVVMQFPSMQSICEPNQHLLNTVSFSTQQQRQLICFVPFELVLINNLHFSVK